MKALTGYIHGYGLKAGIYSSPGPYTCQGFAGSLGHERQDAEQYARWGFDLLKYDQCSGGQVMGKLKQEKPGFKTADFWEPMAGAIRDQDRDILFNLCQYGKDAPWKWAPDLGIQTWRTGGDLNHNVRSYFKQALRLATDLRAFSKPGPRPHVRCLATAHLGEPEGRRPRPPQPERRGPFHNTLPDAKKAKMNPVKQLSQLPSMKPLIATIALLLCGQSFAATADKPNIVFILADDIGYGDFGCYGATKVRTPNVDRLAAQGLRMTDAHSAASVCTPSRYAFLTGEYAFRKRGTGIASGIEGLLIDADRTTVPSMLQRAGYATGIVGKWHLGLGTKPTDYNHDINPGPLEIGFDYAWIMPATGDRIPCVWVENHRVVNLDPADPIKLDYSVRRGNPKSFVNGIPRFGMQQGGKAALWDDENISTVIAAKSCAFIEQHKDGPFFLEVATHNIHVPRVPNPKFRDKSQCGVRGDVIVEFDWIVGQVLAKLDELKLADNTLVIVSSDNGGILDNNGPDTKHGIGSIEAVNGHKFNGVLRGTKGTIWEGGTRLPMIARWPGHIQPGVSDALVCQVDMLASFAALTGQNLAPADGPDSYDVLPALLGRKTDSPCRDSLVEQANKGTVLALRQGPWKYIPGYGGGKAAQRKKDSPERPSEMVAECDLPPTTGALYNLADDLSETKNVAAAHPDIVKSMVAKLAEIKANGKSRP